MNLPLWTGKISYIVGYPFIMLWLRGSKRIYVAIICKNEILVTKNWLGLHNKWRLPGGGADAKETRMEALKRELAEELALDIEDLKPKALGRQWYSSYTNYKYSLYLIKCKKRPLIHWNERELVDAEWIPISKLKDNDCSEELNKALRLIKAK